LTRGGMRNREYSRARTPLPGPWKRRRGATQGMHTRRTTWITAAIVELALVAASCTGGGLRPRPPTDPPRGGTLHLALHSLWAQPSRPHDSTLDPQRDFNGMTFELARCCLLRTLLSFNGQSVGNHGAELLPDLAARPPEISGDGLTWTFGIKQAVRYAPPLQNLSVKAQDFIRAMERALTPVIGLTKDRQGEAASYYVGVIQGAQEFADGEAATISGLEAPDDLTLRIHLTKPTGDLGYRLALMAAAPIPADPNDPAARFGVARGHNLDYGRFLVGTGPYMIAGSEALDFTVPPAQQAPVSGYVPGKSLTLVRNPAWSAASDTLRGAYVDTIQFAIGRYFEGTNEAHRADTDVEDGRLDMVFDVNSPPGQVERFHASPALRSRVFSTQSGYVWPLTMNPAVPPLDDLHVRKAISWVIDKRALQRIAVAQGEPSGGASAGGEVAGHLLFDPAENNLLLGYKPYSTPEDRGSETLAQEEMRQSRYDLDKDGLCDASECKDLLLLGRTESGFDRLARVAARDLRKIGITTRIEAVPFPDFVGRLTDPGEKTPLSIGIRVGGNGSDASSFFGPGGFFTGSPIENFNPSLLGATGTELRRWGYSTNAVPSVDEQIGQCLPLVGTSAFRCWAGLDQLLMEDIVPWVPYVFGTNTRVLSARVESFSFDQFTGFPALDQIALK
jgi:peptide/nickel transport system substrate-binding protein